MTEIEILQRRVEELENKISALIASDRYTIQRTIQMFDGRNIQLAKGTGTKIGTESTQKIGFLGKTPVSQQASIADPSGAGDAGVDQPARTAINSILDVLDAFGFTA